MNSWFLVSFLTTVIFGLKNWLSTWRYHQWDAPEEKEHFRQDMVFWTRVFIISFTFMLALGTVGLVS